MKIALIQPNMGDYRASDAMPPLAIGILAARCGAHERVFYDDRVEPLPETLDADLIAFSVETFSARRAYQLADRYRQAGQRVVMGGHHPSMLPEEALQHADAVLIGDAEGAWERLLRDAGQNCLQRLYRGDHRLPLAGMRIDRAIFAGKRYAPVEPMQASRGCRFACDFCSIHSFYGASLRVRPIPEIVHEWRTLKARRLLLFIDDNLFGPRDWFMALLAALKPLKRRWGCQISIDAARDPALLDAMAEAGCCFALIGFESLNPENLRQMKKTWNQVAGDYRQVVRALHQRGIGIYGTFVFGYDFDDADTLRRSVDFALESRLEIANFNPLTPMPGTGLYERLHRENRLISPFWWEDPRYRYGDPIFHPARIDAAELSARCFEAKRQFYAWSSIARRLLGGDKLFSRNFSLFAFGIAALTNVISRREIYRKQGRALG